MRRLRTLARNADFISVLFFGLVSLMLAWNAWLALSKPLLRAGVAGSLLGLVPPWWMRDCLVVNHRIVCWGLRGAWVVALILTAVHPTIPRGGLLDAACWLGLGLYMGTWFWLMSDDRLIFK